MKLFVRYWKQRRRVFFLFAAFVLIFAIVFALYGIPVSAVLYPAGLCMTLGVLAVVWDFYGVWKKHKILSSVRSMTDVLTLSVPGAKTIEDGDYQAILQLLCQEQARQANQMDLRYQDMMDYYTIWAHQIKTPIASMRLHLQNEDSPLSRQLSSDLVRIEQYVEMVMAFLRLDADSTDYVIREHDLDEIIRGSVRRFSGEFIARKLVLHYAPVSATVITDEMWLRFVIEQALSNALKYTPSGSITISLEVPKTLCIRDTGIGIAPEDLPRIFEKGYTGCNGRADQKASGIGLYLCKRICANLGHGISAASVPGEGTSVRINLEQRQLEIE